MRMIKFDASPKQLSRLRNGHRVRIKSPVSGMGFNLIVDPSKFDAATRSFSRGSAYQIQLTPDELMANRQAVDEGEIEGEGIFAGGKMKIGKAFKKFGKKLESAGKKAVKGLAAGEKAVRKSPVGRTIVKKVAPMLAEEGIKALATYAGADPASAKLLGKIGSEGSKAGLTEAGYGMYAGRGMYAGTGMCGGRLAGPPSRMPEMSSMSSMTQIGGSLLSSRNPALMSDPMGANFHMSTQLPVNLQRNRFV
jgi:hypothetical protein